MKKILFIDLKDFFSNEVNRVFVAVVIIGGILIYQQFNHNMETQKATTALMNAIDKTEKKTDFRYLNLTRSLEDIHKVEINTKDGRIVK